MSNLLVMAFSVALLIQPLAVLAVPIQSQQERGTNKKITDPEDDGLLVEVEFSGNQNFSSEELMAILAPPSLFLEMVGVKTPGILVLPEGIENLQEHLERLRFSLGKKGYLQAKIGKPKVEDLKDGVVKVLVPIEEGACYRIGQITVTGARTLSSAEIVEISGLRYGEPINAEAIQEKIFKDIKDQYSNRGFIQASVDFVPELKLSYPTALEGLVDVTIEIDEGQLFTIETIEFLGLTKTDEKILRDLLLIREGHTYSQHGLNETLRRLNQAGILEEIKEKDVIARTSDRGAQISLVFQVKELSSQR